MVRIALLICFLAPIASAAAHTFVHGVVSEDFWIPHNLDPTNRSDTPGVLPETLDVVFGGADFQWRAEVYPTLSDARAAFERGDLDFQVTSLSWVDQPLADGTLFSSAFYTTVDRLIFALDAPVATAACESMARLSLWGVVGYRYPCDDEILIQRAPGENDLIAGVSAGRFPAVIVEETTARFWSRRLQVPLNIGPVIDVAELRLRLRAPPPGALERVNASIARALRYGVIDEIRERYIREAAGSGELSRR